MLKYPSSFSVKHVDLKERCDLSTKFRLSGRPSRGKPPGQTSSVKKATGTPSGFGVTLKPICSQAFTGRRDFRFPFPEGFWTCTELSALLLLHMNCISLGPNPTNHLVSHPVLPNLCRHQESNTLQLSYHTFFIFFCSQNAPNQF